eukprot:COSAG01_NODE_2108_length_8408_cov_138.235768_2_plen_44_part_00
MFLLYNINPLTVHLIIRTLLALVPSQGMMALCRNMCLPFGAQL